MSVSFSISMRTPVSTGEGVVARGRGGGLADRRSEGVAAHRARRGRHVRQRGVVLDRHRQQRERGAAAGQCGACAIGGDLYGAGGQAAGDLGEEAARDQHGAVLLGHDRDAGLRGHVVVEAGEGQVLAARAGACRPAPGWRDVPGAHVPSRPPRRRAHHDPPGSSPEAASCHRDGLPACGAGISRMAAPALRPVPFYLVLSLGDKEISSRRRAGGSWGQVAIFQPSAALRDHSPCARPMARRGRVVDSRPFSTGRLPVTPRTSGVVLVLSQACPQRYPQPVCTDCYGRH